MTQHDADQLSGHPTKRRSMAALAYGLGWFDQSHFVRDFRTFTGETPCGYAKRDRDGNG
ncbi:MAG: helix-turn-helix domain-containing protein [Brevibacterium yomogidense]|nr:MULTISPECIES: helix-turn-helix domain-containing protein [Brevibacterium]